MCAASPGTWTVAKQQSQLDIQTLEDPAVNRAIGVLHQIFLTCYGPCGKLKMTHNNVGGHVTITSSSSRLLQTINISNPILQLITTAIEGHLHMFSDGGLFIGIFTLSIVKNSLKLNIHRHLLMEVYELLLQKCLEYLHRKNCPSVSNLDLGNLSQIIAFVKSIICTKPACDFTDIELSHISQLIVSGFLRTICGSDSVSSLHGSVLYLCMEGHPVLDSKVWDGMLFQSPHIPPYASNFKLKVTNSASNSSIQVASFSVSLAGDTNEHVDVTYEGISPDAATTVLVEQMLSCMKSVVSLGVGLVVCQKVIHPLVKAFLRTNKVIFIERLGINYMRGFHRLAGGRLIGTYTRPIQAQDLGVLSTVDHIVLQKQSYLHLQNHKAPVCTIMLCGRTEQSLEECKHVCQVADHLLRMSLSDDRVLCGGGCWQTQLSHFLKSQLKTETSAWCAQLSCTPNQLQEAVNTFTASLQQVVMAHNSEGVHLFDTEHHHHWWTVHEEDQYEACSCGMVMNTDGRCELLRMVQRPHSQEVQVCSELCKGHVETQPCVMDSHRVMVNALRNAVGMASMILGIQHYVKDTN